MSALIAIIAFGVIVWSALLLLGRMPARARIPLATAIALGLTGYFVTGHPGMAGAPVHRGEPAGFGEELVDPRQGMSERFGPAAQWLGMSDGLMRMGRTEAAAQMLEQGLRRYPRNVDLWVAYGNALVAHSGGMMTPAATMAFARAGAIDPSHPAPPFFSGLAMAQSGDVEGARRVWQGLLDRSPPNAPWREDLTQRLAAMPGPGAPSRRPPEPAAANPD
jgi:hypothetical protein